MKQREGQGERERGRGIKENNVKKRLPNFQFNKEKSKKQGEFV
jgi:hypothetical protein